MKATSSSQSYTIESVSPIDVALGTTLGRQESASTVSPTNLESANFSPRKATSGISPIDVRPELQTTLGLQAFTSPTGDQEIVLGADVPNGLEGKEERMGGRLSLFEHTRSCLIVEEEERLDALEDERLQVKVDHWGQMFVFTEQHWFRVMWTLILAASLGYIATFFLYQLVFLELHLPEPIRPPPYALITAAVVDCVFYCDLVANFFFSYRDEENMEVDSLRLIAIQYVCSHHFYVNLFSCLPSELFEHWFEGTPANKASRIIRLQRLTKLFRLVKFRRVTEFINVPAFTKCVRHLSTFRSLRILNFICSLFWCLHLLACGWYLCAVVDHENGIEDVWLARRTLNDDGNESLMTLHSAFWQWLHSMYFVMTLFTTVGFGDMSAMTVVEILYALFAFLVTTVLSSIIMGEVINICMRQDDIGKYVSEQRHLVESFADHLQFDSETKGTLLEWVETESPEWMVHEYDKEAMKELIAGRFMPRDLMGLLPAHIYKGDLARSRLFKMLTTKVEYLPPRFPIIFALSTYEKTLVAQEYVYQRQDLANNMFMVLSGTCAHIGIPGKSGGKDIRFLSVPGDQARSSLYPYQLFSRHNYFGDEMFLNLHHRIASVRCERTARVLVAGRKDLHELVGKFPEYAVQWEKESLRREWHRQNLLRNFKIGHTYRYLASSTIQRFFRSDFGKTRKARWSIGNAVEDIRLKFCSERARAAMGSKQDAFNVDRLLRGESREGKDSLDSNGTITGQSMLEEVRLLRSDMLELGKHMYKELASVRQQLGLEELKTTAEI